MTRDVEIKGLAELRETLLREIPERLRKTIAQKALGAGARIVAREARVNARKGGPDWPDVVSGTLARAIYQKRSRWGNTLTLERRIVGVRRGNKWGKQRKAAGKASLDAYYWKFVEFGHRVGTRKSGYLKKLEKPSRAGAISAHKPVEPQAFLQPAWRAKEQKATRAIVEELQRQMVIVSRDPKYQRYWR